MAKTRLTNDDRDAIRSAVIDRKFDPLFAALKAKESAVVIKARARAYGKYTAEIDAAPTGAFATESNHSFVVAGRRYQLRSEKPLRVFFKDTRGYMEAMISLPAGDKLGDEIESVAHEREELKNTRDHLRSTIRATLSAFRTFDDLILAWPEAEPFIKARWQTRPEWKANVPAVEIKSLSHALDLPPETVAEAA